MLNYVNRVIVGESAGADNGVTTLAGLGRGDILVLDSEMTPIVAAPSDNAGPRKSFYVAVGTGFTASPFILSSPIFGDQVTSANSLATRAAADQVSYVGYAATGTDTLATPAIGDVAEVVVAFKDRQRLIANRQTRLVLNAAATTVDPFDWAEDLAAQSAFSAPYADPYGVKVEVVSNGTPTYLILTEDVTVTNGSTAISFAADPSWSAGDLVVIRGITYSIVSADATDGVLSRAYTGVSETIDVSVDTTATGTLATVTLYGLKISGLASPFNNPEIDIYEKPVFELGISDSLATVATYTTAMDLGQGIYEQVKKMEFDAQSYLGNSNLRQWPIPSFDFHAVSGVAYNVYQFTSYDEHEGDLQNMMKSPVGLTIAFSSTASSQEDDISAILDPLIPGFSI